MNKEYMLFCPRTQFDNKNADTKTKNSIDTVRPSWILVYAAMGM